jgi:hypothetical protein
MAYILRIQLLLESTLQSACISLPVYAWFDWQALFFLKQHLCLGTSYSVPFLRNVVDKAHFLPHFKHCSFKQSANSLQWSICRRNLHRSWAIPQQIISVGSMLIILIGLFSLVFGTMKTPFSIPNALLFLFFERIELQVTLVSKSNECTESSQRVFPNVIYI